MKASIIIPAYNSSERLYLNLLSLNYQDCEKGSFEAIIINNGSDDSTAAMLSCFTPKYEMKVINLDTNKSRAAARNIGIENSKGEILIFHDSDMIAASKYVKKHIELHKDERTVICGPGWKRIYSFYYKEFSNYLRDNFISCKWRYKDKYVKCKDSERIQLLDEKDIKHDRFLKKSFSLDFREKKTDKIVKTFGENLSGYNFPWRFFMTNNSSIHRKAVEEIGYFDENFIKWGCEDLDFAYRLYKKGYKFIKTDSVMSVHQEHPVSRQQNASENIYYFTKKYDTIDLLLFYYGRFGTLDDICINQALNEFNAFSVDEKYSKVAEAFRNMLSLNRERCVSYITIKYERNKKNESELMEQLKSLCKNKDAGHFLMVFGLLYKDIYGVDIYKLLKLKDSEA